MHIDGFSVTQVFIVFLVMLFIYILLKITLCTMNTKTKEHFSFGSVPSDKFSVLADKSGSLSSYSIVDLLNAAIPKGSIIAWNGDVNNIPTGWALCNGQNGTPDLRGKFILGYNRDRSDRQMNNIGGAEKVVLTVDQMPPHTHEMAMWSDCSCGGGDCSCGFDDINKPVEGKRNHGVSSVTGKAAEHENMPPYFVLAFIMKL